MNKVNKIILGLMLIGLIFSEYSFLIKASTVSEIEQVSQNLSMDLDADSEIPLYDKQDNIIAKFYKGRSEGYLIVSKSKNSPIEYSYIQNRDFFVKGKKYYYNGPLSYFVEVDKDNVKSPEGKVLSKSELSYGIIRETNFNATTMKRIETRALTRTAYTPRGYSYNPSGICGSTAAAILLMYYNDYVNTNYVPTSYESAGTGEKTVKYLMPYIDGNTPGSNYTDMVNGLNKYLGDRGLSKTATKLTTYNVINPINGNRPLIIGLTRHPKYSEHFVVAYGYNRYQEGVNTIYMMMVSDGWGNTGIYIDRNYCDGGVKI